MTYNEWKKIFTTLASDGRRHADKMESLEKKSVYKLNYSGESSISFTEDGIVIQQLIHPDNTTQKGKCYFDVDEAIELRDILVKIFPFAE